MRNAIELTNDLFTRTPSEWNMKLAEEYEIPIDQFIQLLNSYSYMSTSEDAIHSRMKHLHLVKPNEAKRSVTEDINKNTPDENAMKISSIIRDLGTIYMENGERFNQLLLCGFIFENS